jgi:hypothetical protein
MVLTPILHTAMTTTIAPHTIGRSLALDGSIRLTAQYYHCRPQDIIARIIPWRRRQQQQQQQQQQSADDTAVRVLVVFPLQLYYTTVSTTSKCRNERPITANIVYRCCFIVRTTSTIPSSSPETDLAPPRATLQLLFMFSRCGTAVSHTGLLLAHGRAAGNRQVTGG